VVYLEQIADWLSAQADYYSKTLDEMYKRHPNLFVLVLTEAAKLSWALTDGLGDTLRLGEGVQSGGWGYARDALRVLSVVPAASVIRVERVLAASFEHEIGPLCSSVSITKALRLTGQDLYITVDDMMSAAGRRLHGAQGPCSLRPMTLWETREVFTALGVRTEIVGSRSLRDMEMMLRGRRGVIVFAVETDRGGHGLVAFLDRQGRLRLADRGAAPVASLAELEEFYQAGMDRARVINVALFVDEARVVELQDLRVPTIAFAARIAFLGPHSLVKSIAHELWAPSDTPYLGP
jgi:hypothetical protein